MIVLYNVLNGNFTGKKVLSVWAKPFDPQVYYGLMKRHGMGRTFCMWLVPGTFDEGFR